MNHPAQYSPEVIDVLDDLIAAMNPRPGLIYDPFAGTGLRLAQLCDAYKIEFMGGDIEDWPGHHPNVIVADALDPKSYPQGEHMVVTSPVYQNKRLGDYCNGPTPNTKVKGRRDYGISLGRALSPKNLARVTGRKSKEADYWRLHGEAVKLWPDRVIVNVDLPIRDGWVDILMAERFKYFKFTPAYTRRDRGVGCAECEVVIVASR